MLHAIDAEILDEILGGWLRALADAGRLEPLLTAIAIDGKWLRGVLDGQDKLFAATLQEEKVIIAQRRIPDETTETTQVKALLEPVDLNNAVVTADAVNAQRDTAAYIAGPGEDGGRESDHFLLSRATSRNSSAPSSTPSSRTAPASPTTPSSTKATAGPSAGPCGSPTQGTSTSRRS